MSQPRATRREDKTSKGCGRAFMSVFFLLFPFLFIVGTVLRVWAQSSIWNEFSNMGTDRMGLWILGSIICAGIIIKVVTVLTATGSSTDAERAEAWYWNTWLPMFEREKSLWAQWHKTHREEDHQELLRWENQMEDWKRQTINKLIDLQMSSRGNLLHYTWGDKDDWEYLDKDIKAWLGIK